MARKRTTKPAGDLALPETKVVATQSKVSTPRIRLMDRYSELPLTGNTHALNLLKVLDRVAALSVNPPPGPGRDRTGPDKDRFRDKVRDRIKENLGDIIKDNPIFGDKGKIKVPIDGGKEPRWRPGRDGQGGGGKGRKGGKDKGDLIYVDMDMDEFLNILFDGVDLPFLRKTDQAQMLVKHIKIRGISPKGPRARIDWMATSIARIERALAMKNANPEDFADMDEEDIPDIDRIPFEEEDLRFKRVEERWDPDSKAVAFLVLDRSGSMGGDPLAIAKFFFLLNILFLRYRYKDVRIVMIAHDAQAYEIQDERDFYKIEVDGGTMFVPAYELAWNIAESRFSPSSWNRYLFQATDGYMFDGDDEVTQWYTKFIKGAFEYCAYLEIDPYAGRGYGGRTQWASGGQALLNLSPDVKKRVGMARVSSIDEVLEAFKNVLNPDRQEA